VAVARLGDRLGRGLTDRLTLVETRLERTPELLTGHSDVEPGPARLELDVSHVVVALAVAPCIALGLGQRTQPHSGTVLPGRGPVKNPQVPVGKSPVGSVRAVNLLVLGGTKFLGRAVVEAALGRGDEVTLFNRGRTNPDLFPEVEKLQGDRDGDLSALLGRSWDAVVDTSAYVPQQARASADALAGAAGHYLFISSLSAYADASRPLDEESPLAEREESQPDDRLLEDFSNYGALKVLCERAAAEGFGGPTAIVRPGLIVGPHDPTGRFTYWPHRVARGGEVLAPAPAGSQVQFIDVRDLGEWIVDLSENRVEGPFNAANRDVTWESLLETCRRVTGSDAQFVWIDPEFLMQQEVGQWMELPMWLYEDTGLHTTDVSRAVEAGLTFRPLDETVRGTLDEAETTGEAGLDREREARLIAAWKAR
jgi:2'-hydroxyisoflavone reductase